MYLDSAIIVKLSVAEPDSEFYATLVDGRTDLTASALSLPECRSALARKVESGEISAEDYAEACDAVEEMLSGNSGIAVAGVDDEILNLASAIIERAELPVQRNKTLYGGLLLSLGMFLLRVSPP